MSTLSRTALLFVALLATPAFADDLYLHDGREILGVAVRSESFSKVEYRRKSVTQKVDSKEVRRIEYGRTSPNFTKGVAALASGDSLAAARAFELAAVNEDLSDFVRATAYANCGDALLANNNFADAVVIFDELLSTFRDTRHYARALLGKGRGLFLNRQLGQASQVFTKLKAEVEGKDLGEAWGYEAEFALLWAAEANGEDVLKGYKDLRKRTDDDFKSVANQCAMRMGRVYLGIDDLDNALPLFDDIIASRLSTELAVVAGAFNGRGRCLFWQAQTELQKSKEAQSKKQDDRAQGFREDALASFRAARLDFLRVQTVYRGVAREQPEALYWGGQTFLNVASLDSSELDAERFGKILLKRCADGYATSSWGSKAAAEL